MAEKKTAPAPAPAPQTYTEAPVSLNITCYVKGFKLAFTVRNGDPAELAPKIPAIIAYLEKIGAAPTFAPAAPAAPAPTPAAPAVVSESVHRCLKCGAVGVYTSGDGEKGRWHGYKCPTCDTFVKGTFKRVK